MLIDLHLDTLAQLAPGDDLSAGVPRLHVDLPRLARADVRAAVWAICTADRLAGPAGTALALQMLARAQAVLVHETDRLQLVRNQADLERCLDGHRLGMILGLEGAHALLGEIALLDAFHALGVRVLTLCWNSDTPFASGCRPAGGNDGGLRPAGRALLRRSAELSLICDLAHASPRTLQDALGVVPRPFLVSHTACAALRAHPRNLTDGQLREVAAAGGLVGITFCPGFLSDPPQAASLETVCDHIQHALEMAGEEAVALGSDFDGVTALPQGIEGAQAWPRLLETMRRRGWNGETIAAVAGGNAARVLRRGLPAAGGEVGARAGS
ncbi:MAG: hypothetical protein GF330_03385 [Candidatus Eisenbacteria bacterium]|nr:hypothetical protein [Candidatus Eisenbacteria bacterium]